ncbi:MAG: hypothetical protein R6U96_12355 [Promethearchaeia archaeon]
MLFQKDSIMLLVWIIIGTVLLTLIIYLAVRLIESEHKANDKKFMIFLVALICVLILPFVLGVIGTILNTLGDILANLRNALDGGGRNYLGNLVSIIGFLIVLFLLKVFIDLTWESSMWVALLTLFMLYILYSLVPEIYIMMQFGLI